VLRFPPSARAALAETRFTGVVLEAGNYAAPCPGQTKAHLIGSQLPGPHHPRLLVAWLHLGVLWAFAVAKPMLDVLADSPDFFVARGNTTADIVILSAGLLLGPPTLLVLVEALASPLPPLRAALHLTFVALLVAAFSLQLLGDLAAGPAGLLIAAALALGAGGAAAYARARPVPAVLTVLSPLPLVLLAWFLLVSPVAELVLPQEEARATESRVTSTAPVVMLVFDEFDGAMLMDHRQRLDRSRFPHFAALAARATWYRNATTVADRTLRAVPGLLSGRRPPDDALAVRADYPDTVFSLLGDTHEMHVTETATELCPERLCGERARPDAPSRLGSLVSDLSVVSLHLVLPRDLRSDLPNVSQSFGDFRAEGDSRGDAVADPDALKGFSAGRPQTFERFLRGIRAGAEPGFHFLHLAIPHAPWQYLPDGRQYPASGPTFPGLDFDTWREDPAPVRLSLQRHLLQAGYADHLVGRLIARLRRTGLFQRALVVVTADHGVSYRPGDDRRTTTPTNVADIASVPLFVKYPRARQGRIDDRMARTVDVVPTIAHALGSRLPWAAAGRPLDGPPARRAPAVRIAVNNTGRFVTLPFSAFLQRREEGLDRMLGLFGAGSGWPVLYRAGIPPGLAGAPAARHVTGAADARFRPDAPQLFQAVDPGSGSVPALVTGTISGRIPRDAPIALALNGRIAAVAAPFRDGERLRLAAMTDPAGLRRGRNRVTAYLAAPAAGGEPTGLLAMRQDAPEVYALESRGGRTLLRSRSDLAEVGDAGELTGYVERVDRQPGGLVVRGWAAGRRSGRPADRIVLFSGGRFLTSTRPALPRPDLARPAGAAVPRAGFSVGPLGGANPERIRVFALAGGAAAELPRLEPG
jgi:hypothetical protein